MSGQKFEIVSDPVAEQLDELADLAALWKEYRTKGRSCHAIRAAMLQAAASVTGLAQLSSWDVLLHSGGSACADIGVEQMFKIQEEWRSKYSSPNQQSFSDMTDKSRVDRFGR